MVWHVFSSATGSGPMMGLGTGLVAGLVTGLSAGLTWGANQVSTLMDSPPSVDSDVSAPVAQEATQDSEICRGEDIVTAASCAGDELSTEEAQLYQLVTEFRAENGLPPVPLSPSLTLVANRHVLDLEYNLDRVTHAWSDCPYVGNDSDTWSCMWEAPQRLGTPYPGWGYENAFGGSGDYEASAEDAIAGWQASDVHTAVILNQGTWADREWNALGIGIYGGYAVLWFGEEPDAAEF